MVRVARAISLYETTHTGYETNRDHHARRLRSVHDERAGLGEVRGLEDATEERVDLQFRASWWWAMELLLLGGLSGLGGSMVRVARAISLYETVPRKRQPDLVAQD
jgi:hypothetical protein